MDSALSAWNPPTPSLRCDSCADDLWRSKGWLCWISIRASLLAFDAMEVGDVLKVSGFGSFLGVMVGTSVGRRAARGGDARFSVSRVVVARVKVW